tara:strand:- start:2282 stop:2422 length:141 start_codon:yes stop_codon:yes gene_type:complete
MNIKYVNIKQLPKIKITLKKKNTIKIKTNDLSELVNIKYLLNLKHH